jgi:hypothetical protein
MSKFFTSIAVDVESVKKLLPEGSVFERMVWNSRASAIEIYWENEAFKTPFDHARAFPVTDLVGQRLPPDVILDPSWRKAPAPAPKPELAPEAATTGPAPAAAVPEQPATDGPQPPASAAPVMTPAAKPIAKPKVPGVKR